MTSIVTVSPMRNIYEQVKWKCKAYSSMFSTVLIVYILMGLLSGGMSGSLGTGTSYRFKAAFPAKLLDCNDKSDGSCINRNIPYSIMCFYTCSCG